jgi:hypothetical protein
VLRRQAGDHVGRKAASGTSRRALDINDAGGSEYIVNHVNPSGFIYLRRKARAVSCTFVRLERNRPYALALFPRRNRRMPMSQPSTSSGTYQYYVRPSSFVKRYVYVRIKDER